MFEYKKVTDVDMEATSSEAKRPRIEEDRSPRDKSIRAMCYYAVQVYTYLEVDYLDLSISELVTGALKTTFHLKRQAHNGGKRSLASKTEGKSFKITKTKELPISLSTLMLDRALLMYN